MRAIHREMRGHQAVGADIDFRQILDIDRRVARQPRSHEQRDLVAPGDERTLEQAAARGSAAFHEFGERRGLAGFEVDPTAHVDAAEQPGGVDAVVDVADVDFGRARRAGAMEDVAVAGAIDGDGGPDRLAAFLAFEDRAGDLGPVWPIAQQRRGAPGMEDQMHVMLQHEFLGDQFQVLGIDGRRPVDDAVMGGGAFFPVGDGGFVGAAPQPARRTGDGVLRQAIEQVVGDAADHLLSGPVGHAVDPDDQSAGGQAAEMVVPLK